MTATDQPKTSGNEAKMSGTTYVMFLGLLIDLLAFTLILPLMPSLLDHYRRHDPEGGLYSVLEANVKWFGGRIGAPDEFIPVLFGGLISSLYSLLQFLASPVVGGLSDYYGRRPLLLICTIGVALSYFLWTTASTFGVFVLARFVGGISKGNVSLCTAIVADISTPKTRQRSMALIGIAFSIGFLIGPMLGASLSVWAKGQFVYPAAVAFALSLLDFSYLYLAFEESLPKNKRRNDLRSSVRDSLSYINPTCLFNFSTLQNLNHADKRALVKIGRSYFLYLFLYSGLEFTLTFLTHLRFGFTSMDQGKMFFYIGILMVVIQCCYVRTIPPGKAMTVSMYGLLLIIPSFAIVGFAQTRLVLYVGITLYAISTSVVVTCLNTVVSNFGQVNQKGIIMGVYRSLGALGRGLGPLAASSIYWMAGPELCYSLGGLCLVVPYLMLKSTS